MATYSGAWKKAATTVPGVRLKPPQDPQHAQPDPNPNGPVSWVQDTMVPAIPADWLGSQHTQLPTIHGVIDGTPQDHGHGMGVGHGEDTLTAQDERTGWHGEDLGAVEARRYQPSGTRDGEWHVEVIDDTANGGHSPGFAAMRYDRGVGVSSDPGARVGKRIARWRERWIDMHRWDPEGRASAARYAYSAPVQAAQANGNQYTSSAPTLARFGASGIGSPDQYVTPVERRSPRPWSESQTVDGVAPGSYGLTLWGL